MHLRLKLLMISATLCAVVAMTSYWLIDLDAADGSAGEPVIPLEIWTPEGTAAGTPAYCFTEAGAEEHASNDAPAPGQPMSSKATIGSPRSFTANPNQMAVAGEAPLRGHRPPREIYPTLTRSKPSALSASGAAPRDVGPDHPSAVTPVFAIPASVSSVAAIDNVATIRSKEPTQSSAAPSRRGDLSLAPKPIAEGLPREPTSSTRSPAPPTLSENTYFTTPAHETIPSPRLGRAVLSTEMQRLRAQLGWRAFDRWARDGTKYGEE